MEENIFDITSLEEKETGGKIGNSTMRVFRTICSRWPTNPLEVAKEHGDEGKVKTLSAKYLYHFNKLQKANLIKVKKIGNSYVAWPVDMEKLRVVHEILRMEGG
ncbi:MAG: hypothetical protein JW754_01085 [Candidatus Aenigmarchaeota archaeon]|nr:hypothetical protein [Candidatus Aenigmarchaeota archaeon]